MSITPGSALGLNSIGRIHSPSSINTYRTCPRKYYYQYIEKLPVKKNISLVKGSIVHSVLEDFFDLESLGLEYKKTMRLHAASLLNSAWVKSKKELDELRLDDLNVHFDDAAIMVSKWLENFINRIERLKSQGIEERRAYSMLVPKRELEYRSEGHAVRGFIDAIEEGQGKIRLIDYKTSKSNHINDQYYLQLSLYALLYEHKHGKLPDEVALNFLRHGEKSITVTRRMVDYALQELKDVHKKTLSKDIADYPIKRSGLCKWSTGQCDFYECCIDCQK